MRPCPMPSVIELPERSIFVPPACVPVGRQKQDELMRVAGYNGSTYPIPSPQLHAPEVT